jgi:hypothetical protein
MPECYDEARMLRLARTRPVTAPRRRDASTLIGRRRDQDREGGLFRVRAGYVASYRHRHGF